MINDAVHFSPLRLPLAIPFDEDPAAHEHDDVVATRRLVADPAFRASLRPARWIKDLQRFNRVPIRANIIITLTMLAGIVAAVIACS